MARWTGVLLLVMLTAACQQPPETRIARFFIDYSTGRDPGAVVMVIRDGEPVFKKAYGMAHLEESVPMVAESNMRLASVSKQFTAMCIAMLVERGKLSLAETLTDLFPAFPAYGRDITVAQLVHHTSGLLAYEDLIPDTATVQVQDADVLQMMLQQDSTYFEPGTKFRYSNTGYALLAMIIGKVSGMRFAEFLDENIFQPVGMTRTVAFEEGVSTVPNRAYGYAVTDSGFVFRDQSLTSAVLGDGGIYSSVEDLFKWDQILYTDRLVSRATFDEAKITAVPTDDKGIRYGFGWRHDEYRGHARMHHTGTTCGFSTVVQRYPEDQFSIIILTNRNKPRLWEMADRIADLYLSDASQEGASD